MTTDRDRPLWTVKELAEFLQISAYTVTEMARTGRLRGTKIGGKWRFRQEEVDRFVASCAPAYKQKVITLQKRSLADLAEASADGLPLVERRRRRQKRKAESS